MPIEMIPVPAFSDNYLWLLARDGEAVVVDPGDAAPVEAALKSRGLRLSAILVTHHHPDHIGGIKALLRTHAVPVYGPRREHRTIPLLTRLLDEGDQVEVLGRCFAVLEVPGHTLGHIAYFSAASGDRAASEPPILLCGDTLFSGGCGRLFEGTAQQMHASLTRLAQLPADTRFLCAHEYTASNLAFARAVETGSAALAEYSERVLQLRAADTPTLPGTIGLERAINPFLRSGESAVRRAAEAHAGQALDDEIAVFAALRTWKDNFRAVTP